MSYLYLLINIFTISIPLLRSFESRIHFYKNFKGLFLGITIAGTIFIVWDIIFTMNGIWGFNPRYLIGLEIFHLPLEEWLFFITVPYASVFIYEVLNYFLKNEMQGSYQYNFTYALASLLLIAGFINYDKWYTLLTFSFSSIYLFYLAGIRKVNWLGKFFRAFAVILIPFFIVNGILTGTGIEDQIVWYNDNENLGIRIFTIPIEDSIYGMLLILISVHALETFRYNPQESRN